MKRVLFVIGTRPEAIKLAPVILEARTRSNFESVVCVTAQHRELLDQSLAFFGIRPDFDLDIMRGNQSLFDVTSRILNGLQRVIEATSPQVLVVQGDTTTAMTGALSAYYSRIAIAHVEAGLRTGSKYHPFPEEMNRVIADMLADMCFAPTESAERNLLKEGIGQDRILMTGNTVVDALLHTLRVIESAGIDGESARHQQNGIPEEVEKVVASPTTRMLLVTTHRRESFGRDLESICKALIEIVQRHDGVEIVFPVHPNPAVRKPVTQLLGASSRIHLIDAVDYPTFVWLLSNCYFALTDSGGLQEEAPVLGKPLLIMREHTERPEGIARRSSVLVGVGTTEIVSAAERLLNDETVYAQASKNVSLYGDGKAAARIIDRIDEWLAEHE